MDLWAIHVKSCSNTSPIMVKKLKTQKSISISRNLGNLEIIHSKRNSSSSSSSPSSSYGYRRRSFVLRAMAKNNGDNSNSGNGDQSIPESGGFKGKNPSSDGNGSNDTTSHKSHRVNLDWREFRATLFAREQAEIAESDSQNPDNASLESKPLGLKWAHPIPVPETGCVLVATEKLDGVRSFERTVVLLLRSGTRHPQEGPFGVVINRPLHKKIKHMKPNSLDLATTFGDCSLHFGGPLEASMFILRTAEKSRLPGFEEVIPGICFGARNSLDEAAGLVKKGILRPQDFRFFLGYAGWQLDQLREEIESDYWYVAACSANLICAESSDSSSEGLWEEILQLMGGHYSELSRKPKQDM
ncbi:Protein of unknown function UPF0301 [Dillenia turbinata]|uniref:Uncharacterized protein n=1 Tax=Dillenia turbinata TaxID=194707 RepID=A0AAN8W2J9_9MAGN